MIFMIIKETCKKLSFFCFLGKWLLCLILFHVVCNLWFVDMSWRQWLDGYLTWNLHGAFSSTCPTPASELSLITGLKICAPVWIFHQQYVRYQSFFERDREKTAGRYRLIDNYFIFVHKKCLTNMDSQDTKENTVAVTNVSARS